ncbi:MAG TPA: DUF1345 domain-containing protein [Hyphomicrobiales bacterium]|nr:DUF1345 domain-containing protein [Hyphomicrobiales bacterium]
MAKTASRRSGAFGPQNLRGRTRLIVLSAAGIVAGFVIPGSFYQRVLLGWDVAVVLFLAVVVWVANNGTAESMRRRAAAEDEGVVASFLLSLVAAIASVGAIGALLVFGHDLPAARKLGELALAAGTILLSWLFTHAVFALHYAHVYYLPDVDGKGDAGGLDFPGDDDPDYWDFLYFAYVIGATSQTSDTAIQTKRIRRLALAQGVIAFFFNTTILAMTVNIAASLI